MDHLQRFTQLLPDEGRAQDRMSRDDLLPCSLKGISRECPSQGATYLSYIDARLRCRERMEEQSLLQGRERIDILYLIGVCR
jgi:hypothetical protein